MVEDRVTNGKRIAQLLASELTGLQTGPLERMGVDDADRDATPAETGTLAYRITDDGDPVGEVYLYPEDTEIELEFEPELPADSPLSAGTSKETVQVTSGAQVKAAVDLLRRELPR